VSERFLGALRFTILFGAAFVSLALAFDPRYRDFPLAAFVTPAAGYALLGWVSDPVARAASAGREERVLAAVLALCVPVIVWRETLANVEALAWAGLCLLLAAGAAWPVAGAGKGERAEQEPDRARLDRVGRGLQALQAAAMRRARASSPCEDARSDGRDRQCVGRERSDDRGAQRAPPRRSGGATKVRQRLGFDDLKPKHRRDCRGDCDQDRSAERVFHRCLSWAGDTRREQ
jgi:hypothetical protein